MVYFLRRFQQRETQFTNKLWLIVWTDNEQALVEGMGTEVATPRTALIPEYDVISDIHEVCRAEHIPLLGKHVHSHQEGTDMLLEVELNEFCYDRAKHFVAMTTVAGVTQPTALPSKNQLVALFLDDIMATNRFEKRLSEASMAPTLKKNTYVTSMVGPQRFSKWIGIAMEEHWT